MFCWLFHRRFWLLDWSEENETLVQRCTKCGTVHLGD
jgi:uncharacterized OB-fold protein